MFNIEFVSTIFGRNSNITKISDSSGNVIFWVIWCNHPDDKIHETYGHFAEDKIV